MTWNIQYHLEMGRGVSRQPDGMAGALNSLVLMIFCVCMKCVFWWFWVNGYIWGIPFIRSQRDYWGIFHWPTVCIEIICHIPAQNTIKSPNHPLPGQCEYYTITEREKHISSEQFLVGMEPKYTSKSLNSLQVSHIQFWKTCHHQVYCTSMNENSPIANTSKHKITAQCHYKLCPY